MPRRFLSLIAQASLAYLPAYLFPFLLVTVTLFNLVQLEMARSSPLGTFRFVACPELQL